MHYQTFLQLGARRHQPEFVKLLFTQPEIDHSLAVIYAQNLEEKLLYLSWCTWSRWRQLLLGIQDQDSGFAELLPELWVHLVEAVPKAYAELFKASDETDAMNKSVL